MLIIECKNKNNKNKNIMCELGFGTSFLRNENKVLSLVPNAARLSIEFEFSSLKSSTENCGKVGDECSH